MGKEALKDQKNIAFFDFDGTLTQKDTFWDFHIRHFGKVALFWALLKTSFFAFGLKGFKRDKAKAALLYFLWKNTPYEDYCRYACEYGLSRIEGNLQRVAVEVLDHHLRRGDDVYIVTASMKEWVEPWASRKAIPVIGTEFEVRDGKLTGHLATPNCRGPEKVTRIKAMVNLTDYAKIYAYGNSSGDIEMLALADEKAYNWDHVPVFE